MKTGKFIELSYQKEINRIQRELQAVLPAILAEEEIIRVQRRIKTHETLMDGELSIHFNCGGGIYFSLKGAAPYTSGNPQEWMRIASGNSRHEPGELVFNKQFSLEHYHLRVLKTIHPKRFPEMLRAAGKKFLLVEEKNEQQKVPSWWVTLMDVCSFIMYPPR